LDRGKEEREQGTDWQKRRAYQKVLEKSKGAESLWEKKKKKSEKRGKARGRKRPRDKEKIALSRVRRGGKGGENGSGIRKLQRAGKGPPRPRK